MPDLPLDRRRSAPVPPHLRLDRRGPAAVPPRLQLDRGRWSALVRRCTQLTGDRCDAEDAVQDAVLAVLRRLPSLDPGGDLDAYLWVAARRAAGRTAARRRPHAPVELGELPDPGASVEETVVGRELAVAVRAACDEIPERQRAALLLFDVAGYDGHQVGERLDLDPNAVNQLVFRARRSLRRRIEQSGQLAAV
jgi:RNA polymerase sigma-70 factor (ECF subfamily)